MIPEELKNVGEYLSAQNIQLPAHGTDSRQDSAAAESHIVHILQNSRRDMDIREIYSPNVGQRTNRAWYDVKVDDHFCDIKVSALRTNDNTNAKKAIYYFLTEEEPEKVPDQEKLFFKMMVENENPSESRDYYYIVINKNNTRDIFVISLKGIAALSPAPNNPPFQCHWGRCRDSVNRSWRGARDFLLTTWATSIRKKMENAKLGMPFYYPEFFNDN